MPKLNQVVASEKSIKTRAYEGLTGLHRLSQKADMFTGFSKSYRKKDEDGEDFPAENKKVQANSETLLTAMGETLEDLFNVTASKDYANCVAKADVVVNGTVLLSGVPATYLLFLEKQLNDVHKFVETLPVLDESDNWTKDVNSGLYKTSESSTHRTKKVQKPIVLYAATERHPAQTQLITEDVVVGYWNTVKHSGAMPAPRKKELLDRVNSLSVAVKHAREQANMVDAAPVSTAKEIFGFLLA